MTAPSGATGFHFSAGPLTLTLLATAMLTLWRVYYLWLSPYDLYFDEAQYWGWAQHFDWGYYSKPPVVAWAIMATTAVCGDGEWCIKLASPLAYGLTTLLVYAIGRQLYDAHTALWAALTFLTLPAVTLSSSIISTDPFLLLFWTLALYAVLRILESNAWRWWLLAGAAAGLGLMSKYSFLFFLPSALMAAWLTGHLALLRQWRFCCALLLAFLIYSPNLWWNLEHGLVSYAHTHDNANLRAGSLLHPHEMLEFFAAQFGVFGPILFAAFLWLLTHYRRLGKPEKLLMSFILPFLTIMLLLSFVSRAHANWAAPVYIAASVLVPAWLLRHNKRWLLALSLALHLSAAAMFYHYDAAAQAMGMELSRRHDPFYRVRGWREFGEAVSALREQHPETMVLADTRKVVAELLYYGRPRPFPVLKWNDDAIQDHYDLTIPLDDTRRGQDFLLISDSDELADIFNRFAHVSKRPDIVIPIHRHDAMRYHVYLLGDFQGYR